MDSMRFIDALRRPAARRPVRNWAGNHCLTRGPVARPRSETELVELVRRARERGTRLKVVGAGHSWCDIACTDGTLVSLDDYRDVLSVDRDARRVTVQAGIRLHQLCAELERHGLALSNLGSICAQSIAGAISTATHGTGRAYGNLATQVQAMRLVTGSGDLLDLDRTQSATWFRAAAVGLGALGVVSTVTLDVEPAFNLEETTENRPLDALLADPVGFDRELGSNQHLKLWWLPHTETVRVYRANRTTQQPTPRTAARRFEESALSRALFSTLLGAGARAPAAIPQINRLVRRVHFLAGRRVAPAREVFNVPQVPRHREIEYAVPLERATEALALLRELIAREQLRVNFIVEARFVAADDLFASPDFERDSCHIGAYMAQAPGIERYFERFEALMLELDGRPHWGKEFHATRSELAARHPGLAHFRTVRDALDPHRVFDNAFLQRVL